MYNTNSVLLVQWDVGYGIWDMRYEILRQRLFLIKADQYYVFFKNIRF